MITKAQSSKLPYMSFKQVAQELNCSLSHVKNMVKEMGLEVRYFGKKPLLRVEDVIQEIEESKRRQTVERLTALK